MSDHVQVFNPVNGQPYATAPTPKDNNGNVDTTDNSNKIATTEWVRSMYDGENSTNVKSVNGNAPDSNGNITPAQTGCLPLTGGRMVGKILFNVGYIESYSDSKSNTFYLSSTVHNDDGSAVKGSFISLKNFYDELSGSIILNTATSPDNVDGPALELLNSGICRWNSSEVLLPIGSVFMHASNTMYPYGCLLCNGAEISRTTYSKLFNAIGTTYGSGDGSTTFNLPNLTNRFIQGNDTAGVYLNAGLPNITGYISGVKTSGYGGENGGALYKGGNHYDGNVLNNETQFMSLFIDASRSNGIYGSSTTVQPPALTMRYYIKY